METKQYPDMECDVVIAGCGVAGLYAALNLPTSMRVIMLSKGAVDECDSMLAQGGICVLPEGSDYDAFFEDTMHAGHYENRRESVDIMIRSSRSVINDLLARGVDFERKADPRGCAQPPPHCLPCRHYGQGDHDQAASGRSQTG